MNMPKLILLCGIPGAGKSTYAQSYVKQFGGVHLSSDSIRKELYGDEAVQGNPNDVFSLMQERAIEALNNGKSVLYDATNITRKDRAGIVAMCPTFVQIECHIIWAPIKTCIERDASRERTVGKQVTDKMLKRFQPPFYDEGIHEIKVVLPDNWDAKSYNIKSMDAIKIPHDNPHHTLNIYDHCKEAAKCAEKFADTELVIACILHDVGKPYVKSFKDKKDNDSDIAHYYQHECVSAYMSYGFANVTPFIAWLIGAHMEPFHNSKYYKKLPPFLKQYVDNLHECDVNAH